MLCARRSPARSTPPCQQRLSSPAPSQGSERDFHLQPRDLVICLPSPFLVPAQRRTSRWHRHAVHTPKNPILKKSWPWQVQTPGVHADDPVGRACSASAWSPCPSKPIRLAAARPPLPSISCTPTAASASSTRNVVPFTAPSLRPTSNAASSTPQTST